MSKRTDNPSLDRKHVFITPHTHWDREWYLPFQKFRFKLVKLVDELLDLLNDPQIEFYFTFDGQTIILEDYFEIRPEKQAELLKYIRNGKIAMGPWYLLPDIWLVGQESLIRNLEFGHNLANNFNIPLMNIGYLPDMFGHSRAIPQLIGDLTDFKAVVVWRGVPPEVTTVPFKWKSDLSSKTSVLAVYMPFGYGNAASLPGETEKLEKEIISLVKQLKPFSPLPVYLLHNGTDHLFPNKTMITHLPDVQLDDMSIKMSLLEDFVDFLQERIKQEQYSPPQYVGELRSSARAHLLQDTYSTRMWIKQWNQKVEDMLVHYAEPLNTYTWIYLETGYPFSYMSQAWKWHLRNQPHDSICGCSVDQTHEEMKFRYYWAESLAELTINDVIENLQNQTTTDSTTSFFVFNPTNCNNIPLYTEFNVPERMVVRSIESSEGSKYEVQSLQSTTDVIWEMTVTTLKLRALMKMLPGRQLMNFYINKANIFDGKDPEICEVRITVGDSPIGDLDAGKMKTDILKVIESKKYKKFHIVVTKELEETYFALIPLQPWSFTKLSFSPESIQDLNNKQLILSAHSIENDFYTLTFNKNGTFDLYHKETSTKFQNLHYIENWGDRGDEYTFGRLEPEFVHIKKVKRNLTIKGSLLAEITQNMDIEVYKEVNSKRDKRVGKTLIAIETSFRFYRDLPRIDIKTSFKNTAKDHRLRICFDLPFKSDHTISSTHFGSIKRRGDPVEDKGFIEKPSGVQPQKRYIRVEDPQSTAAITLINRGLPEVELVEGSTLAMTLLRAVGWLSQSDFPERPELAGPRLATPGAQELGKLYVFDYSILIHSKTEPLYRSEDHSEAFSLIPKSVMFKNSPNLDQMITPILQGIDPKVRLSSMRVREKKVLVTMFNLTGDQVSTTVKLSPIIAKVFKLKIDGSIKDTIIPNDNQIEFSLTPYEIAMFALEKS